MNLVDTKGPPDRKALLISEQPTAKEVGKSRTQHHCLFPIIGAGGLVAKNPPSGALLPATGLLSIPHGKLGR